MSINVPWSPVCVTQMDGATPRVLSRTFTTTPELLDLQVCLQAEHAQVAMEVTGSYWKSVYNLLCALGSPHGRRTQRT